MTKLKLILFNIVSSEIALKEYKEALRSVRKLDPNAILNALLIPLIRDIGNARVLLEEYIEGEGA